MIRPTANTPNIIVTTVSVISHLGRFQPTCSGFPLPERERRTPHPVPGKALTEIIIDLLASPWSRISPFVRSLLQKREECDFRVAGRIQQQGSFPKSGSPSTLVAETTFAIIKQL